MNQRHVRFTWIRHHFMSLIGVGLALITIGVCLAAPRLAPYDPTEIDLVQGLQPPSSNHWLGTDQLGRDVLSRLLWGGQISVTVTFVVLLISLTAGVTIGLVTGYFGGLLDELGMRLTDFFYSLPSIILALALIGTLGPSLPTLIAALAVGSWVRYARLTRSLALVVKECEFVLAARALGATDVFIMQRHILPALLGPVAVQLSLDSGLIVLSIASLSFLGMGIQPPTPEWGTMLVDARPFMDYAPHLVLPPGLAIFILVFGCNALSELLEERLRH